MPQQKPLLRCGRHAADRKAPSPPRLVFSASSGGAETPRVSLESLLASGFHELLGGAPGDESTALGFALSMAAKAHGAANETLCFCSLASEVQEYGVLHGHGLCQLGIAPSRLLMVTCRQEKDLLWTLEEAVTSGAFGAVIGALSRQERLYAFPQSRRLKLRVMANETPLFLLRHWQASGATAVHGRWRVTARPSRSEGQHGGYQLLGPSRLQLALERMASTRPQSWEMDNDSARGFHMVPLLENGQMRGKASRQRQAA